MIDYQAILQNHGFRKLYRIKDGATNKHIDHISFPTNDGAQAHVEVAPSKVIRRNELEAILADHDAALPSDEPELTSLLTALAKAEPEQRKEYAQQAGWNADKSQFSLVGRMIGTKSPQFLGARQIDDVADKSGKLSASGTAETWRDSIAQIASHSSIMMFAICIGLAAPLLAIVDRGSFSISIFGRSRRGKTLATLAGASLLGIGRSEDLMNWRLTEARLGQRLPEYNDMMLPIDEMATMKGNKRAKYDRLYDFAYSLAGGWEEGRHSSFMQNHGGKVGRWRCILLTQSEHSVRSLAESLHVSRGGGEAIRLIDVPALLDGLDHLFDRLPTDFDFSTFTDWQSATFAELINACKANHGAAFDAYIENIICERAMLRHEIESHVADFVAGVCDQFAGPEAIDLAQKCGIIYAGGRLGVKFGIVNWSADHVFDAVAKCFRAARALLPDDGQLTKEGVQALRAKLKTLPRLQTKSSNASQKKDAQSGYKEFEKRRIRYLIRIEDFKLVFASQHQRELVTNWLIAKRRIALANSKAKAAPAPQEQFVWHDGKRRRSHEIFWPRRQKKKVKHEKNKATRERKK